MAEIVKEKIRKRVLLPLIIVLIFLLGLSAASIYMREFNQINSEVSEKVNEVEKLFEDRLSQDARLLNGLIDFLEHEKDFQATWLAKDREMLFSQTEPFFNEIRDKYRVTHFYFINIDGVCFLRVHNPKRHSDFINRFTMQQAMANQSSSYGIELGPFGTFTLRRVYPWYINDKLSGYIELGEEIDHITPELKDILNVELIFMIDKTYLKRTKWEEGLKMLGQTGDWERFDEFVVVDSTMKSIPENIVEKVTWSHKNNRNQIFKISDKNTIYRGSFIQLIDAGGRDVGDMVILQDVTKEERSLLRLFITLLILCLLVGGTLITFFYFYLGRIETSLQEAEEKVKEVVENKSKFISMVSHELRTPLTAIKGAIDLVLDGSAGEINEDQEELVCITKDNVDRLYRLINDVLDFQKLDAGMMVFDLKENNINEIVKKVHDTMELVAKDKRLYFKLDLDDNIRKIKFDKDKIIQVLTNIVNNSIKFTEEGGINISTREEDGFIRVTVSDTGPGIEDKDIKRVFRSFEQVGTCAGKKHEGTGLGLAISKEIIARHNGKIWVESECGKGTSFIFTLPVN